MFCDLVGSTELSTRFDPEDLREIIRSYQDAVTHVIRRYDGYVAKYMGDGVLVYFGYPQAHERDAERAVRSALGIVEAIADLNGSAERFSDVELAVRIGIDTGLVVVGETVGEGDARERTVVGETPNLAARLQGLAQPNGIVIGSVTRDLAGDGFVYEDLRAHELKGVTGFVKAWGVCGLNARAEDDGAKPMSAIGGQTPLVGRDEEIGLLRRAWQQTKDEGRGQVVLINGEPGIGKTALVDLLRAQVRAEGRPRIAFHCSPFHAASALYPVIEHLKLFLKWQPEDTPQARLGKLEAMLGRYSTPLEEVVPLFAGLLSLPLPEGRYPPLTLSPQQIKERTQDTLIAWTLEEAERQPVVEVWENLHWADPSTLELLGLILEQAPTAAILIVLTFRPDFVPPWSSRSHMTPITLSRLERPQTEVLVTRLSGGKALPAEVVDHIVIKTDGVPLYVEELSKTILGSGILREELDGYALTGALSTVSIPATLQETLMARLDRTPTVREVAQLGAVLGREFTYEMLQAIGAVKEIALREGLGQLVEAELLYQRGRPPRARYIFKHALIQDAAYESLLKRTRQRYHQQVAALLETQFIELVENEPELMAHHCTQGGLTAKAISYWQKAGERASERSAYPEAISHLAMGLDLLAELPETRERDRQELELQVPLAAALLMTKGQGAPEVAAAYGRARELCRQLGDTPDMCPVLVGLWRFYNVRSDFDTAQGLAEQLLRLAEQSGERLHHAAANYTLGAIAIEHGEIAAATSRFEEFATHYSAELSSSPAFRGGIDPVLGSLCWGSLILWLTGYPDQAAVKSAEAVSMARDLLHPYSLEFGLWIASLVSQCRRDPDFGLATAEEAVAVSTEHGFPLWLAWATVLRGRALAAQGKRETGLREMEQGLAANRSTGATLFVPIILTSLAEVYAAAGRIDDGLQALTEARAQVDRNGERWWEAEVYRVAGEMLSLQGTQQAGEAETRYQKALEVAGRQGAKSLELRAATDLARLWRDQGRIVEARDLLATHFDWFTEGLDTPDLMDAKALLDALA
jgi:class 3 adenylate cyclase/predicted ATPase